MDLAVTSSETMSRWDELGEAARDFVGAAARAVEAAVQGAGDAVADCMETAGNAVQDGANAAGEGAGRIPAIGGLLRAAAMWSGDVVAGLAGLAGAVLKGGFGLAAGAVGGALQVGCGGLLLSRGLVVGGLLDLGASLAGQVLLVLGTFVALVQKVLFLQHRARALTGAEREMLRRVFRRSVSLYNVRLVEGRAGVFELNGRPFTLGNTIYLKHYLSSVPGLLVHECVHVWQYQNVGPRYVVEALGAQVLLPDAYDWAAEIDGGKPGWPGFNKEAQAQLIEDTWLRGSLTVEGHTTTGGGAFFDLRDGATGTVKLDVKGTDRTALAVAAAASLRGRISARWSKVLCS
jgi:hypothetical protein